MTKEKITIHAVKQDLTRLALWQQANRAEWRFTYIFPITLIAVLVGIVLKNVLVAGLIFLPALYHIVRYVIDYRAYKAKKSALLSMIDRGDISVSLEKLSHIAKETVYEPHYHYSSTHSAKEITVYYFDGGSSFRVPNFYKHYEWSKEYYISTKGLENISLSGDEFFFISLQDHHDISYIYPCKNFELGGDLINN